LGTPNAKPGEHDDVRRNPGKGKKQKKKKEITIVITLQRKKQLTRPCLRVTETAGN